MQTTVPGGVSVSIATYNNRGIIDACLDSVMRQSYPVIETVVVDNASTDGTSGHIKNKYPDVRVIINPANELFCKAQNQGMGATKGEFVLMLNSDVVLDDGFVEAAVAAMRVDPKVGSVSGRVLRTGGGVIDTAGLFLGPDRRPVERGYGEPDDGRYMEPGYVFGAGGVCPLYRQEMLSDTSLPGGEYLDETYGAFYEDLDLAWRASRRGWKAYYEPAAIAYHERGATARTNEPRFGFLGRYALARLPLELRVRALTNRYLTIIKNDTFAGYLKNLPSILLYELRLWSFVVLFSPGAIPGFARGMVKYAPRALGIRRVLNAD